MYLFIYLVNYILIENFKAFCDDFFLCFFFFCILFVCLFCFVVVWRLWDVNHTNSLTYYDIRQVILFLMEQKTDFGDDNEDDLLESLFNLVEKIQAEEALQQQNEEKNNKDNKSKNKLHPVVSVDDADGNSTPENKETDNNQETENDNNETKSELNTEKENNDDANNNNNNANDSNNNANMNKNENVKMTPAGNDKSKEKNKNGNNEDDIDPYLNYPTVSFEYFYRWCEEYKKTHSGYEKNGLLSWVMCTFPPKKMDLRPKDVTDNWNNIAIGIDCPDIDEKNDFLIVNRNENINRLKESAQCMLCVTMSHVLCFMFYVLSCIFIFLVFLFLVLINIIFICFVF